MLRQGYKSPAVGRARTRKMQSAADPSPVSANTFTRENTRTCFGCDQKPPSFRLISLERFPNQSQELEPDCVTGLFCEACLKLDINEYFAAFAQTNLPLGSNESAERRLADRLDSQLYCWRSRDTPLNGTALVTLRQLWATSRGDFVFPDAESPRGGPVRRGTGGTQRLHLALQSPYFRK